MEQALSLALKFDFLFEFCFYFSVSFWIFSFWSQKNDFFALFFCFFDFLSVKRRRLMRLVEDRFCTFVFGVILRVSFWSLELKLVFVKWVWTIWFETEIATVRELQIVFMSSVFLTLNCRGQYDLMLPFTLKPHCWRLTGEGKQSGLSW